MRDSRIFEFLTMDLAQAGLWNRLRGREIIVLGRNNAVRIMLDKYETERNQQAAANANGSEGTR